MECPAANRRHFLTKAAECGRLQRLRCHARPVIIDNPGTTPLYGHKRVYAEHPACLHVFAKTRVRLSVYREQSANLEALLSICPLLVAEPTDPLGAVVSLSPAASFCSIPGTAPRTVFL